MDWKKTLAITINSNIVFIDRFHFFSIDSLVKHLGKIDFQGMSQEFDSNVIDLSKKGFSL